MTRKIVDLTCPECQKAIQVPFEVEDPPNLDEITSAIKEATKDQPSADQIQRAIQEQLDKLKPKEEAHRHKTADEFLDCPECRSWVDTTAKSYQVVKKEPAAPAPAAMGSIFKTKSEG